MIKHEDRPFDGLSTAIPFRGTKDDALNGYHPEVNLADPNGLRFGSYPEVPSQRWVALLLSEKETEVFLRLLDAVQEQEELGIEERYVAQRANLMVRACIADFVTYEEREAQNLSASTPIHS